MAKLEQRILGKLEQQLQQKQQTLQQHVLEAVEMRIFDELAKVKEHVGAANKALIVLANQAQELCR